MKADYTFGQDAAARAYISFTNEEDIFTFRQQFDGYVFLDNTGKYSTVSGTRQYLKNFFVSVPVALSSSICSLSYADLNTYSLRKQ